ncbi:MAG TPA: GGDEF domain-containing protein [Sphaerochaeta sp.]|nr:GGDEF domain-containing protein [Sphaerochaeta sp.]
MSVSFFVRCDLKALVEETYWSDPVSIALPSVTNVQRLFDEEGQKQFLIALSHAVENGKPVACDHMLLAGEGPEVSFLLLHRARNFWMLATEDLGNLPSESRETYNPLLSRLIGLVASTFEKYQSQDAQTINSNFEQIHKLNNELVNTYRELMRVNLKLETLNTQLNNRLVKDPLTKLISRYQYHSEISLLIEANPDALGVFAFIDIDEFKKVNDTYGHAVGDSYLIEFSRRLSLIDLGYKAIFMRIAGDEFGIYMYGMDHVPDSFVETFWERAQLELSSQPIFTEQGALPVFCSAGLAVYNRDTTNVYELIEFADQAMYLAKRSGKHSCRMFDRTTAQ